jgi:4'-phosphopantetheinyl transferase EntD
MPRAPYIYCYAPIERLRPMFEAPPANWLSEGECRALARMHSRARRETFLAGRLLAKRLVLRDIYAKNAFSAGQPFAAGDALVTYRDIEIRSEGKRPEVLICGRSLDLPLSIAHTSRAAMAALGSVPDRQLGIDLVELREYGHSFAEVWFTPGERCRLAGAGPSGAAIVWAIKEATYKATNSGEPFDPRLVELVSWPETMFFALDEPPVVEPLRILHSGGRDCRLLLKVRGKLLECLLSLRRTGQKEVAVSALVPGSGRNGAFSRAPGAHASQVAPFFAQRTIGAII